MNSWLLSITTLLFLAVQSSTAIARTDGPSKHPARPLVLYVSSHGRDNASGRLDDPLRTLVEARDRLRLLNKPGAQVARLPRRGVTILIRGGVYFQPEPFTLTASDDQPAVPVTYTAFPGEKVEITGGQEVHGWQPVTDESVLGRLDPAARGHVLQTDLRAQKITEFGQMSVRGFGQPVTPAGLELFFNDAPMTLARWPNADVPAAGSWAHIAGTAADQGTDHFSYDSDRPARWTHAEDAWVYGYWQFDWADRYTKLLTVDAVHHQIRTPATGELMTYTPGHRWYALNLLEELDTPGEWYLDRQAGILYFWPPSDISQGHPCVSRTGDLIRLEGVSNVTLRGLTLEACRGDALTLQGGSHDLVDSCTVRSAGDRGVVITGATDSGVRGGEITGTGEGGVVLDGGDRKTLTPGRDFVERCRIYDYSRWSRTYRPAVSVSGVGNRVAHNLIYDAPHNAILLSGNDHLIEYNEIHHVCQETGDSGACIWDGIGPCAAM